jgi:hypothetical protein
MKVYSWRSFSSSREHAELGDKPHHRQINRFVAAKSMAAVARLVGVKSPKRLDNLGETRNARVCEAALAEPGVVFVESMNRHKGPIIKADTKNNRGDLS